MQNYHTLYLKKKSSSFLSLILAELEEEERGVPSYLA
jgi:hypothetical protein